MPLARVVAWVAAAALHWTLACLHSLARLPIAQWRMPDPSPLLVLIAAAGIVLALVMVRQRRSFAFTGVALLLFSSRIAATYRAAPNAEQHKLEITAIDVGQGDSLLVISPEGRTMLIDGGGSEGPVHSEFDFGEDVVAPYLWSRGLEHLDVIALTHAHGDHIGGLPRIVEDFHPAELWVGINPEKTQLLHLLEIARANNVAIRKHVAGDEMGWGGTKVRVLSPPPDWQPSGRRDNDASLALLIGFGETKALLTGDLEKKMERFVAFESPRADLLKV